MTDETLRSAWLQRQANTIPVFLNVIPSQCCALRCLASFPRTSFTHSRALTCLLSEPRWQNGATRRTSARGAHGGETRPLASFSPEKSPSSVSLRALNLLRVRPIMPRLTSASHYSADGGGVWFRPFKSSTVPPVKSVRFLF